MSDIQAAFRMIDTFASVGANSFVVTKTEPEWPGHKKKIWGKSYSIDALREKLPGIVRTAAIRHPVTLPDGQKIMAGENVIIRPTGPDISFIQLDDLKTPEQIERVRPAALVIHATSPGNCQAWIAVSGLPEGKEPFRQFNRRVRSAIGANDEAASRATRLAGTENFKAKYSPNYPVITIVEAHPGRVMTPEQLESLGLVASAEKESANSEVVSLRRRTGPSDYRPQKNKAWPNYAISLAGAPRNDSGDGPDRSMADFTWCMTAIDWGWPIDQTAAKLQEVSQKARERVQMGDEGYPVITAQNAAAAVERNGLKRGRG